MFFSFHSREKVLYALFFSLALLLAACGGGGDSSSGGGSESIYAGTYTGTETYTISTPGVPPQTEKHPLTVVVASNGDVVITDSEGIQYSGSLTGESLSATGTSGEVIVPGATCPATTITYTGSVSGSTITGSLSGAYNCTLSTGAKFTVTIAGTFTVTLQSAGATALGVKGTKRSMLENYLRGVVGH